MRKWFCIFVAGVWTFWMFLGTLVGMVLARKASGSMFVVQRLWSPVLIWAGGGQVTMVGRENLDPSKPAIYVSNHQSTLDIPVIFRHLWPVDLRFVAKKSLQYVPVLGWYMWLSGFVFVDRGNHGKAIASLDAAAKRIHDGTSVVVFPEGTRSDDGRILPFKKGPFAVAMKANVPLYPVTIEGTRKVMPKNSWAIVPGPITIRLGKPIDPAEFNGDRDALIQAVRNAIIDQSVEIGGLGGDKRDAVAAKGKEGIGKAAAEATP